QVTSPAENIVSLRKARKIMFLLEAKVDEFIHGAFGYYNYDLARLRIRDPLHSILRLQVIHEIERPIQIDRHVSLRECKPLAGRRWVSNQQSDFRIFLECRDRFVSCYVVQLSIDDDWLVLLES